MQIDPRFQVGVLSQTRDPATLCWQAMHQDYSEGWVFYDEPPAETDAGERIIKHLLLGGRGHYGPLEHASITFAIAVAANGCPFPIGLPIVTISGIRASDSNPQKFSPVRPKPG